MTTNQTTTPTTPTEMIFGFTRAEFESIEGRPSISDARMEELVNGFCGPAPMTDEEIDEAVTASEISQMEREQDANETWNKQNEDCGHVMTDEEYAEDCEIFAQAMEDAWGI